AGEPRAAQALDDLALKRRELRRIAGRNLRDRLGRLRIPELRWPGEEERLAADLDPVGVAEWQRAPRGNPRTVQERPVVAATVLDVPALFAEDDGRVPTADRVRRDRQVVLGAPADRHRSP